jgi:Predicted metal-binding integral membrane protein (DUF2182)
VSSSSGLARPRPGLATREAAFLLILAAGAWAATVALARGMAGMLGTMGLGLAAFVPVWTLMMAAMMLPSVSPTASLHARTIQGRRAARIAGLVAGYLAVWAAAGLPAYGLAWLAGWMAGQHPGAAHVVTVAAFAVVGIYQLSPLKDRCLAHCRSPLGLLLHLWLLPGQVPRPARRRPSRRILPGLLLGPDGAPDRSGRDERGSNGRPGRPGADRESLAMGSRGWPARRCRRAGLCCGHDLAPWLAPGLHAAPQMMMN